MFDPLFKQLCTCLDLAEDTKGRRTMMVNTHPVAMCVWEEPFCAVKE